MKKLITATIFILICMIPQNVFAQSISELEAQGKAAFHEYNYSLLEDKTREIIKQSPNHRWANLQLGFALRAQGKLEDALRQYQKTLDFNSTDGWAAYAYNGLGNALLYLGRLQEASSAYNQAVKLKPNHDYAYRNLGILSNELGKPQEAIKYFKKQLKVEGTYPHYTYTLLADTLNSIGNKEEAIKTYKEALNIVPQDAYTYMSIANILVSQNKIDEAISYYRQALRLPDYSLYDDLSSTTVHTLIHTNLGVLLLNNNSLSEARIEFQKALDIDPSYTYAQENLEKIGQAISKNPSPNITTSIVSETIRPQEFKNTLYEKFYSVVHITVIRDCNRSPSNTGTGWIIKHEKNKNKTFILTNRHVVFDKNCSSKQPKILVDFFNGQNNQSPPIRLKATIAHIDSSDNALDLAVIEVKNISDNSSFQALKMSSKQIGEDKDVRIIGHPINAEPWFPSRGYTSKINIENMAIPAAFLNSGNSGSPVLDSETLEVVGMVYNVLPATEPGQTSGLGNAYPIEIIKKQLRIWRIL